MPELSPFSRTKSHWEHDDMNRDEPLTAPP